MADNNGLRLGSGWTQVGHMFNATQKQVQIWLEKPPSEPEPILKFL